MDSNIFATLFKRGVKGERNSSTISSQSAGYNSVKQNRAGQTSKAFCSCLIVEVKIAGLRQDVCLTLGQRSPPLPRHTLRSTLGIQNCCVQMWVCYHSHQRTGDSCIGCLEKDVECMGRTLHVNGGFVLKDPSSEKSKEPLEVPGIVGLNVIGEI